MQSVIVLSSDLQMIFVSLQKELLYKTERQPTHADKNFCLSVWGSSVSSFFLTTVILVKILKLFLLRK